MTTAKKTPRKAAKTLIGEAPLRTAEEAYCIDPNPPDRARILVIECVLPAKATVDIEYAVSRALEEINSVAGAEIVLDAVSNLPTKDAERILAQRRDPDQTWTA